nr:heme-binding protein [uncultured Hyphomonas sp.]
MRKLFAAGAAIAAAIFNPTAANAAQEPPHEVIASDGKIEVRQYKPQILAEVTVTGDMRRAGNSGFRPLADFIFGNNTAKQSIEMTAPVTRTPASRKIEMTAPVMRTETAGGDWVVAFVMPEEWTMETLPVPNNPDITIREVPGEMIAAIRFNGAGRESAHKKKQAELEAWLGTHDYVATGSARYAGYSAPWVPAPFKRNEVMIPVRPAS